MEEPATPDAEESLPAGGLTARAGHLLANPAFTDGNTGFQTGYTYFTGSPLPEGRYVIERTPREHHPLQADFGDHTTGTGLMIVVNGGTLSDVYDYPPWQETVPVAQNGQYVFTGWTTTANSLDSSPARLAARINGQTVLSSYKVPNVGGNWQQFSFSWPSLGSTTATISRFDLNTDSLGNDTALDDFSFSGPSTAPSALAALGLGTVAVLRRRMRA